MSVVVIAERETCYRDALAQRREPLRQGLGAGAVGRTVRPRDDEARHAQDCCLLDDLVERAVEALQAHVPPADLEPGVVQSSAKSTGVVRSRVELDRLITLCGERRRSREGVDRAKCVELDRESHQPTFRPTSEWRHLNSGPREWPKNPTISGNS